MHVRSSLPDIAHDAHTPRPRWLPGLPTLHGTLGALPVASAHQSPAEEYPCPMAAGPRGAPIVAPQRNPDPPPTTAGELGGLAGDQGGASTISPCPHRASRVSCGASAYGWSQSSGSWAPLGAMGAHAMGPHCHGATGGGSATGGQGGTAIGTGASGPQVESRVPAATGGESAGGTSQGGMEDPPDRCIGG